MTSKHQKLDERRQILQTTGCNEVGLLVKICVYIHKGNLFRYKENKILKFAGKYVKLENILSWVTHT